MITLTTINLPQQDQHIKSFNRQQNGHDI